jgi:hypothetical protein
MMDIETHTSIYLRDLLATPAADGPGEDLDVLPRKVSDTDRAAELT